MSLTLDAWVIFIIISVIILSVGLGIGYAFDDIKGAIIGGLASFIICLIILFVINWYYTNTADGSRAIKTQESNFHNGIERRVEVYDAVGNKIKEYEGKFDLEYDDDRILFDDENGQRHIIYYPTGTVIIDEVD